MSDERQRARGGSRILGVEFPDRIELRVQRYTTDHDGWSTLLVGLESCPCGGRLVLVELVTEVGRIKRLLEKQLGMSLKPPRNASTKGRLINRSCRTWEGVVCLAIDHEAVSWWRGEHL